MPALDLGILLVAALGAFLGFQIGGALIFFSLLGGLGCRWLDTWLFEFVVKFMPKFPWLAHAIFFWLVGGAFVLIGIVVSRFLEASFMSILDKVLGVVLGAVLLLGLLGGVLPDITRKSQPLAALYAESPWAHKLVAFSDDVLTWHPSQLFREDNNGRPDSDRLRDLSEASDR